VEVTGLKWAYEGKEGKGFGLEGVSFTVKKGGRLGITGPIGSGKTTLFNLLVRLQEPPAGTVRVEGRDALELEPRELRRRAGYALQTVHLYSATVRENLAFGLEPEPEMAALEKAAADAEILEEIKRMPEGWETPIGEKGVRLSGGQKQRLALARLLLRDAPLLLLDDAMSAVDQATEQRLLDKLFSLDSALIVASHRAAALRRCDEVLLMSGGRVVDRGPFPELAKRHPHLADA
jgi:ATP-binding cassette subfamily B protein